MKQKFLPISRADMEREGIEVLDFVFVIGDAYVDHPSFGPAIISRVLESKGYTVGIISGITLAICSFVGLLVKTLGIDFVIGVIKKYSRK